MTGAVIAGVAVLGAEAFASKCEATMQKKVTLVTSPIATDAFSVMVPTPSSTDDELKLRSAFLDMDSSEIEARQANADKVFARAAALLAGGMQVPGAGLSHEEAQQLAEHESSGLSEEQLATMRTNRQKRRHAFM